jgi:hypothetical protein
MVIVIVIVMVIVMVIMTVTDPQGAVFLERHEVAGLGILCHGLHSRPRDDSLFGRTAWRNHRERDTEVPCSEPASVDDAQRLPR